ncbi:hypothetical protein [Sphingomonas sp. PAMC26645]|uniref:hypothetical protein n=1 Tax=Sphingomonas sp. PAMC26645 TaxID=2565555 RepID=UPI001445DAA0|nr:hypothetical protein [Sphingomonas sp. PAMC26645]
MMQRSSTTPPAEQECANCSAVSEAPNCRADLEFGDKGAVNMAVMTVCRRRAPTMHADADGSPASSFPRTMPGQWCAEWSPYTKREVPTSLVSPRDPYER